MTSFTTEVFRINTAQTFFFQWLFVASELDAAKRRCPSICPEYYSPICASNGKTYGNICIFRVAACRDPSIKFVKRGTCVDSKCVKDFWLFGSPMNGSHTKLQSNNRFVQEMCQIYS